LADRIKDEKEKRQKELEDRKKHSKQEFKKNMEHIKEIE